MTSDDKPDSVKEPQPTERTINVAGSPVSDLPESKHDRRERTDEQRHCFESLKHDFFRRLRKASFLLQIIGTITVGIYTCQSIKAVTVAQDNLVASERPWVSVEAKPISPLTFDQNGGHVTVQFLLANLGKSPATGLDVWGYFVCPSNSDDALKTQESWCAGRRKVVEQSHRYTKLGYTIFPTDRKSKEISFQLNESDIKDAEPPIPKWGEERSFSYCRRLSDV